MKNYNTLEVPIAFVYTVFQIKDRMNENKSIKHTSNNVSGFLALQFFNILGNVSFMDIVKIDLSNITQPRKGSKLVIESFTYFN